MLEYALGILGVCMPIIGWNFHLNSRVSVLEQQHIDLKELINTRFDATDFRLGRIERSMNGRLKE